MTQEKEIDSCINFNKNSWHYRLVIFIFGRYWQFDYNNHGKFDTSLCTYMRHVVGAIFIFPFKGTWHILPYRITQHRDLIIIILMWALGSAFFHYILPRELDIASSWYLGIAIFFGGIGIALLALGVVALIMKINELSDKFWEDRKEKPRKQRKPSLAIEYFKAKKSKICPCIKFVDDEEEKKIG